MAVQCVLVGKGKDDVFTAVYDETTFDKVLKAYNEKKVVQVIYQNRIYYLDNTTIVDSPEAFSFISAFSNQNDETGEIKHYVISLMTGDSWSGPFLQKSTPATHAKTHAKNGTDPLTPADIGAMELSENILKQSNEDITSQVAQALSGDLVPFSGGTMTGLLNVLTPVGDSNATTKKYVDDALSEKIGMDGIGDLHVWRKTVVTSQEIPAGYTLEDVNSGQSAKLYVSLNNSDKAVLAFFSDLVVPDNGKIERKVTDWLVSRNPSGSFLQYSAESSGSIASISTEAALQSLLRGKFVFISDNSDASSNMYPQDNYIDKNALYYIPMNATVGMQGGHFSSGNIATIIIISKLQKVNPYPSQPAEAITTYPVSTNRNAYQEGNDAKPAGYTLGEVVMGSFRAGATNYTISYSYEAASELTVSDDGRTVSMTSPSAGSFGFMGGLEPGADPAKIRAFMLGKFVRCTAKGDQLNEAPDTKYPFNTIPSDIVYIPSNAQITMANGDVLVDRYQPVTGYAAIPANTTIEYLGYLGEKKQIEYVSYIGTGAGRSESAPVTLSFSFPPKIILFLGQYSTDNLYYSYFRPYFAQGRDAWFMSTLHVVMDLVPTEYTHYIGFGCYTSFGPYGKKSADGKKLYWYAPNTSDVPGNQSGVRYDYLALG